LLDIDIKKNILMNKKNTIYALSSVYGKSGVAVFRISGENCIKIISKFTKLKKPKDRRVCLTKLYKNKKNNEIIDRVLLTYFKGPKSYTGEDCIEISAHGSPAIINALYRELNKSKLCIEAEPGEFTKRSFENNRLDLTQVEAVSDLINAQTESQRNLALSHLEGNFSKKIKNWANDIKHILANAEALIDFSEDEVPHKIMEKNSKKTKKIINEIRKYLNDEHAGEKIRSGIKIAIIGKPNTGKSSLINYLAKREIAIVSNIPGTTRDIIELNYDIRGIPVIFYDTAGLRKSSKRIESIGIVKSIEKSKLSDINIIMVENTREMRKYNIKEKNKIFVQSKIDKKIRKINKKSVIKISSKTGYGITKLINQIYKLIKFKRNSYDNPHVSRERHRNQLILSLESLEKSLKSNQIDIKAEEIRKSYINISKIYGKYDIDEILDVIFNDFCIGK
tara:strand:- start:549 stop:1898 length:1350 start_codon:yes stop_codon:yes gene_type:complete